MFSDGSLPSFRRNLHDCNLDVSYNLLTLLLFAPGNCVEKLKRVVSLATSRVCGMHSCCLLMLTGSWTAGLGVMGHGPWDTWCIQMCSLWPDEVPACWRGQSSLSRSSFAATNSSRVSSQTCQQDAQDTLQLQLWHQAARHITQGDIECGYALLMWIVLVPRVAIFDLYKNCFIAWDIMLKVNMEDIFGTIFTTHLKFLESLMHDSACGNTPHRKLQTSVVCQRNTRRCIPDSKTWIRRKLAQCEQIL
jgi:hypothetical protein